MFPVSAVTLKNPLDYALSLGVFFRSLLHLVDYRLDEEVSAREEAVMDGYGNSGSAMN
jgi:hypothetical protein